MKNSYEELVVSVLVLKDEFVRASAEKDPFDDDYQDPNLGFVN